MQCLSGLEGKICEAMQRNCLADFALQRNFLSLSLSLSKKRKTCDTGQQEGFSAALASRLAQGMRLTSEIQVKQGTSIEATVLAA